MLKHKKTGGKIGIVWFFIFFMFSMLLSKTGWSVTIIHNCPTTWTENEEYIFGSDFPSSTCNIDANNIILNGNNTYLDINLYFSIASTIENLTIKNFEVKDMYIKDAYKVKNLEFVNNSIYAMVHTLFPFSQVTATFSHFVIKNNYIRNLNYNTYKIALISHSVGGSGGTSYITIHNATIQDNIFLGFESIFKSHSFGASSTYIKINGDIFIDNNIMDVTNLHTGGRIIITGASDCNYTITSSNFLKYPTVDDNDINFVSDTQVVYNSGNCYYYQANPVTRKEFMFIPKLYNKNKRYFVYNHFEGTTSYFEDNSYNYLTKSLILNSTDYINMNNVKFTVLDLSLLKNQNALILTGTNQIRLGSNNILTGGSDTANKPIITNSGTINIDYDKNSPYNTNWQLISIGNNVIIDNLKFVSAITGNYGWIRSSYSNTGNLLEIKNSVFDYNNAILNKTVPVIHAGDYMNIHDNYFEIDGRTERVFGVSGLNGGHKFQDNTFRGAGLVFQDFSTYNDKEPTLINHNEFTKYLNYASYPFNISSNGENPLGDENTFKLNGSYYYKTACDSYEFNVGNWYNDISNDISLCLDSNSNEICDDGFLMSSATANIIDYKPLKTYPYPFINYLGNAVYHDLCGDFVFSISKPINNTDYDLTTGNYFEIQWSYSSNAYPVMRKCYTKLNNNIVVEFNVTSNDIKSYLYQLTTGAYILEIVCENDYITKSSGRIYFTINNGTDYIDVSDPIVSVYGCTDPNASNYNPNANINDGSCTYTDTGIVTGGGVVVDDELLSDIYSTDITTSAESSTSFIGSLGGLVYKVILPISAFIIIFIIIGILVNIVTF